MRYIFLILLLAFFSCKKEEPIVDTPESVVIDDSWDLFYGKDKVVKGQPTPNHVKWLLVGGTMYMENLMTGYKIKYNHFDGVRLFSSLRYSGYEYDIEVLEVGKTTWQFRYGKYKTKEFVLNNDTLHPYGYNESASFRSIIELSTSKPEDLKLGGSARPFNVWTKDYDAGLIEVKIQEGYEGIDGYNWRYFTVLTFKLVD
jgi:hypothetical protein